MTTDNITLLYKNYEDQFMEAIKNNPLAIILQKQASEIERLSKQINDMGIKFESLKETELCTLKQRIGELEENLLYRKNESEKHKSEIKFLKQENKGLKNQITYITKDINKLQTTVKEFNEQKKCMNEMESHIQQNEEDNISLEIRVNKLEKVQEIWNKAAAKFDTKRFKKICEIHEKYKISLIPELKEKILSIIDLDPSYTQKQLLPAYSFFKALKQFSDQFLQQNDLNENQSLSVYLCNPALNFWPENVPEELFKDLFPNNLKEQASRYHGYFT
ncbi:11699_t:CDS:2 [Diversispora eburnea]|uniref:11699_t:CDS:1 n=1 Tax=Diversispora eburnea TaxID=1213867 RepID=A0A9N8Z9J5_9GLOM|nr:11699_t:CDS:2 [Diversispora eburnea]